MKAIEVKKILFRFDNRKNQYPFELSVDNFSVEEGEFISILGPNGCGKSTFLKLISNLLTPLNGDIEIFGEPVQKISLNKLAQLISFVPQSNYSIFPFSVLEIVMMGRTPYLNMMGFENETDKKIVDEALAKMQVDHLRNKGIGELSGGEAQRVFIARALAQKSKIILLDEPSTHMDIEHQIKIFEMLKQINMDEGITILTVSHDLNLVGIYLDRTVVMQNGKVMFDGDKKTVLTKERIKKIFNVDVNIFENSTSSFNVLIKPVN